MKAIVIYYSLSGNTRKIAQAIHKGMGQLADQCDIVAVKGARGIPGMRMGHLLEYDLIGIGSPVWRSLMTPNIMDFIYHMPTQEFQAIYARDFYKELTPEEKQHYFFFMTHGKSPGGAVEQTWKALNERNLTIIGWEDWYGDSVQTYAASPWWTHGHPDDIALQQAEAFGRKMVDRSLRISQGETDLIPELPTGKEYEDLYGEPLTPQYYSDSVAKNQTIAEGVRFRVKHFYGVKIIEDKCVKCGICEDNCPMDAIDLDADDPILPTCIWCTACEMVCPVGAIDLNMAELKKDRGETEEELRKGGQIQTEKFMEEQKKLRPEKRMRWHIDPKDVLLKGYISDITDNPRVVIPEQGWRQLKKTKK